MYVTTFPIPGTNVIAYLVRFIDGRIESTYANKFDAHLRLNLLIHLGMEA